MFISSLVSVMRERNISATEKVMVFFIWAFIHLFVFGGAFMTLALIGEFLLDHISLALP